MSEKRLNDELTNPELLDLEASLRGLSAVGNVNRDELLFEAGRRSANDRSHSRSGIWKGVSTVLALMLIGQSFAYRSIGEAQIADENPPHEDSATAKTESSTSDVDEAPHRMTACIPDTPYDNQESLPSRRSKLLMLRRIALSQGVDAAFSTDTQNADLPTRVQQTQRELLRELLGS